MKRTLLIATAALLLLAASSCQKDGVYNPKKKIGKIVYSGEGLSMQGSYRELWKWDGNKLVSRAISYSSPDTTSLYTYTYDGKRLAAITYKDFLDDYYCKTDFTYDGKELQQADYYVRGILRSTAKFTHTDGKITAIDFIYQNIPDYSKGSFDNNMMLDMLMPLDLQQDEACQQLKANSKSGELIFKVSITWDGNNISKMEWDYDGYIKTNEFTYDNKRNPFCGLGVSWLNDLNEDYYLLGSTFKVFDKNNILASKYQDINRNTTESVTYTYTYKGDYPTSCIVKIASDSGTTSYEYEYLN